MEPAHVGCYRVLKKPLKQLLMGLLMALFWTASLKGAEEGAVPAQGRDFPAFKLIYERNIFNPNRRPLSVRAAESEPVKPAKIERFSLIGTLIYEDGSFAFSTARKPNIGRSSSRPAPLPDLSCLKSPSTMSR